MATCRLIGQIARKCGEDEPCSVIEPLRPDGVGIHQRQTIRSGLAQSNIALTLYVLYQQFSREIIERIARSEYVPHRNNTQDISSAPGKLRVDLITA